MKWSDAVERMMLIKVLEQNGSIKLDIDRALGSWPIGLDKPTKRGLGDRFMLLKKQIREGRVAVSVGSGSTMTPSSACSQPVPVTPVPKPKDQSSRNKPTPKTPVNLSVTDRKQKVKAKVAEPSEEPSSSSDKESADEAVDHGDTRKSARVQPSRRSKSATPGSFVKYKESDSDDDQQSVTEAGSASESESSTATTASSGAPNTRSVNNQGNGQSVRAYGNLKVKKQATIGGTRKKISAKSTTSSDTDESAESEFEPRTPTKHGRKRHGQDDHRETKKRKLGWRERVAMTDRAVMDEDDDEQSDDMQC